MFQSKVVEKNRNTHFVFHNFFFNRVVYEIMWKNFERGRPQTTILCMRMAC